MSINRIRFRSLVLTLALVGVVLAIGVAPVSAQTPFIPYYGKNQIHYDTFDWHIYTTDHFEIYYYPELEPHLERVAGYAESAYQQVSAALKHDLATHIPLVLFKTHSEFEQQNIIPGAAPEGVAAFAEPSRNRMVLPLDDPPDLLYRLIVHELTHIFEFDVIPRSLVRAGVPLWVDEGLADYMTADWRPLDLMTIRDAAASDIVPKMSELEGYGSFTNPRLVYNLGHAAFEFIEARWGKEGLRQYLFELRKSVIGGGGSAFEEAFKLKPNEFDQQFEQYLKARFKPFRDKERPADYGNNLAPNPARSTFQNVLSIEPSPTGDLIAAFTGNRRDGELDIVLMSSKDGQVIRNLTSGFDKDRGFEYLSVPGARWNTVPWMSWSPSGDRLAYFVRTEKRRTLILQDVATRRIAQRVEMRTVDEPESPDLGLDGRLVAFSAIRGGVGDIYTVDLDTGRVTNLTNDAFADYAPTFSPDGTLIVYVSRISGSDKLFKLDLTSGQKTQLTFGTHDDGAAQFLDANTIVFPSTATNPLAPIAPEVEHNGRIYNLWTLDLRTGELRQHTDVLGGNLSPVALKDGNAARIAFVTYDKGAYGLHTIEPKAVLNTAASSDFGAPGPVIDFQAPFTHTLVAESKKKKPTFGKWFADGRPPVSVGVTSGGDLFGGTTLSFADVLGDRRIDVTAASVSQYRTLAASYVDVSRRLQWAVQGFSQTQFFFGQAGTFFDPGLSSFIDRDLATATRTVRGASGFAIYPLDRYRRLELSAGVAQYTEQFENPDLDQFSGDFQQAQFGRRLLRNGTFIPLGATFVQETTVFREFGPLAGNTMRLAYEQAPGVGGALSRRTVDADVRYYQRLGATGVLALRARGFRSSGDSPDFLFFGGNSEMRGYQYLEFLGQNAFFGNAELRFPLIDAMATPIGILGGIRGLFFFNIGGAWFDDTAFTFSTSKAEIVQPVVGARITDGLTVEQVLGPPTRVSGFRLKDGRASYGLGLETFALGFPVHLDWSWRTLFNKQWEDVLFAGQGGSGAFRKARFDVWIGYDF
ncbi:MAG: PD40 domain-containing protein [Acidobacteria bacterium]|nr:PD40 domain-containing protein [Acidobacteriota bacterium]